MDFNLFQWLLVFLRASALLALFPIFSARNTPVQVRVALGAATALLIAPNLPGLPLAAPATVLGLMELFLKEIGAGLLIGFMSRMIFFALDFAGGLMSAEIGLLFSPDPDPFSSTETQAPGLILYYLAAMLMLSLDLHHWLLVAFQRSYTVLPAGGAHLQQALMLEVLKGSALIFRIALQIAAPVVAVSFIITLLFSVLGRAVPQMNVFSESFAIRALAGLSVFGLTMNLMASHISNYLRRLPDDLLRVAQLMGVG